MFVQNLLIMLIDFELKPCQWLQIKANSFTIVSTILGKVTSLPFRSNPSVIPLAAAKIPLNVEKISGDINLLQATPW